MKLWTCSLCCLRQTWCSGIGQPRARRHGESAGELRCRRINRPTVRERSPFPSERAAHVHTQPSPVPPADIVVFGGTGDLAVRKLLPALYLRDRDGQLTPDTRIVATSRAGLDEAGYRDKIRGELPRFVRPEELDAAVVDRFVARLTHVSLDIDRRRRLARAGAELPDATRCGSSTSPSRLAVRPRQRPPGRHDLVTAAVPAGAGEADRPRPRLGPGDQRRRRRGLRGAARSSGSTTTWARRASRTCWSPRFANTFLEPLWNANCDRPRPDHRLGVARRRHPRRLLRRLRRAARHGPEPPAPAALPGRDGAARRTSAARPCVTRSSRSSRRSSRSPAERRGPARRRRAVPCRPGRRRGRRGVPRRRGAAGSRSPRPSSRSRPRCRTGAGPACRSTCAPASGWRARCSEIVIQFKPVPHPMFPRQRGHQRAQPAGDPAAARRGHALHLTAKEPGPGGIRLRPVSLDLNYAQTFQKHSPDAYERLLMDSDGDARAKKRDLVHTVLRGLANVIQQQLFGELVAALQIADTALREIYFRIATAQPSDRGRWARTASAGPPPRSRPAPPSTSAPSSPTSSARSPAARAAAVRRDRGPGGALRPRGRRVLAGEHAPRRRRREGAVAFRRRPPASRLADRRADRGRASPEADRPALATRSARWRTPPTPSGRRSPSARCAPPPRR